MTSATCSNTTLRLFSSRIDKKDRKQLAMKSTMATTVISSIIVVFDFPKTLRYVNTTKHRPSKLEDALRI